MPRNHNKICKNGHCGTCDKCLDLAELERLKRLARLGNRLALDILKARPDWTMVIHEIYAAEKPKKLMPRRINDTPYNIKHRAYMHEWREKRRKLGLKG